MRRAILVALCFSSVVCAATPKVIFTKSFPGSIPEYVYISVDRAGALQFTESRTDDPPLTTQLPDSDTAALFDMADKLDHFKSPLEAGLKVANMGKKTFRYQDENGAVTEATFNYSANETAQQLLQRFEQISSTEHAYLELDRTVHFDKLGVNDALAQIESLWLHKELAAPLQFIPLLTRIATHESFMHLVRERSARLKEEFTTAASSPQASSQPQK